MHFRIAPLLFVSALLSFAQTKVTSVEGITEYRLDNGLRLLVFPDPSKPNITVNMATEEQSKAERFVIYDGFTSKMWETTTHPGEAFWKGGTVERMAPLGLHIITVVENYEWGWERPPIESVQMCSVQAPQMFTVVG